MEDISAHLELTLEYDLLQEAVAVELERYYTNPSVATTCSQVVELHAFQNWACLRACFRSRVGFWRFIESLSGSRARRRQTTQLSI